MKTARALTDLLGWLDWRRAPTGLALGAGVGVACGVGAVWLGAPAGLPLGLGALAGAAALGFSGSPVLVPLPLDEPLEMVELPGGAFWMGSPEDEAGRYEDEGPRHRVRVSPFAIGRVPVTKRLYREVCGDDPGEPAGDELPVNNVNWFDALRFCNRLSERVGLAPCYHIEGETVRWDRQADGYRLPTEAEWEYAARGETKTAYSFGRDPKKLDDYAWYNENSKGQPQPVGQKKPNRFGLHDMHGNVWEWCFDGWTDNYNDIVSVKLDPVRLPVGAVRVVRGGSFNSGPRFLRAAFRVRFGAQGRFGDLGFRCVRGARIQP